jgi:hypothetical protein
MWRCRLIPQHRRVPTRLQGVTTQKTNILTKDKVESKEAEQTRQGEVNVSEKMLRQEKGRGIGDRNDRLRERRRQKENESLNCYTNLFYKKKKKLEI